MIDLKVLQQFHVIIKGIMYSYNLCFFILNTHTDSPYTHTHTHTYTHTHTHTHIHIYVYIYIYICIYVYIYIYIYIYMTFLVYMCKDVLTLLLVYMCKESLTACKYNEVVVIIAQTYNSEESLSGIDLLL